MVSRNDVSVHFTFVQMFCTEVQRNTPSKTWAFHLIHETPHFSRPHDKEATLTYVTQETTIFQ